MRPVKRRGFTLIEMLIVVVIIGLLAVIAIPKFYGSKGQALIATMKSDLRNLVTAQEGYLSEFRAYYSGAVPGAGLTYSPSTGVTIVLSGVTSSGWQATATHSASTRTCTIFVGNAPPLAPATAEGTPACT